MRRITGSISFCFISLFVIAQESTHPPQHNEAPINAWYGMTGIQLIFSGGSVMDNGTNLFNIVRFTCFFHLQQQYHYDVTKYMGFYTGFSIINVGFINTVPLPDETSANLKQRSYSLGIPLGIKLGDMPLGNYLAFGVEEECMFAYKQKILYDGNKSKSDDDLFSSDNVNLFNTSLLGELRFHNGAYLRFKYYLFNFLENKTSILYIGNNQIAYTPEKSTLYYISLGLLLKTKHKHHLSKKDV